MVSSRRGIRKETAIRGGASGVWRGLSGAILGARTAASGQQVVHNAETVLDEPFVDEGYIGLTKKILVQPIRVPFQPRLDVTRRNRHIEE